MAIPHAQPGQVVDVSPLGSAIDTAKTYTILKTPTFEVIRIVMVAGKQLPPHAVPGEIIVQCLEGTVDFRIGATMHPLTAGSLLYCEGGTEHALHARENASLLVTIALEH